MTHKFDINIAEELGVNAAVIYDNIEWWCRYNEVNNNNNYDGRYWTYNSISAWTELFPYLGKKAIDNALKKLENAEYIVTGNYNKSSYDRTKWYAVTGKFISPSEVNGISKKGNTIPTNKPTNKHKRVEKPTLDQVEEYISDKQLRVDAVKFFEYFEAGNWTDSNGNKVKNWKQKLLTWNNHSKETKEDDNSGDITW